MKYFTDRTDPELLSMLRQGAVGILRTDTLYGLVASARNEAAVERVFTIRGRERTKACIVLIGDKADLFDTPNEVIEEFITQQWPGPVSIAVASPSAPSYLRFGDGTIAYRLPATPELRALLKETGPLIAPSANMQNEPPARSIEEAKEYFGDQVDFYVDSGVANNLTPSQLWVYRNGGLERIR